MTRGVAAQVATLYGVPSWALDAQEKHQLTGGASLDSLDAAAAGMASVGAGLDDRIAIRHLIDAWAHCADRRLRKKQTALFTEDGVVENYDADPAAHAPLSVLRGRQELFKALAVLNTFAATTHFNGQSTIVVRGDQAYGESYCLAYQMVDKDARRTCELLSIRYLDDFVRRRGRWFFQKRRLIIDWKDTWTLLPEAHRAAANLVHPFDHVELTQLLIEVAWRVDNRKASTIYELFVEDGSVQIESTPIVGWQALRDWGKSLDANPSSGYRLVSNQRFLLDGSDQATGWSTISTYSDSGKDGSAPNLTAIFIDHDTYVRTASGWRFKSRRWMPRPDGFSRTDPKDSGQTGARVRQPGEARGA